MSSKLSNSRMPNINFVTDELSKDDVLVIFLDKELKLSNELIAIDHQYHGLISKNIQNKLIFAGEFGQIKTVVSVDKHGLLKHLVIVGLGELEKLTSALIEELGGKIMQCGIMLKAKHLGIRIISALGNIEINSAAAHLASGALLASYRFDKYLTKQKESEKFAVETMEITVQDVVIAEKLFLEKKAIATAVFSTRDFVNEPGNILYPDAYAERIIDLLEPLGIEIDVIGEREMRNLGMGALLGVGQGSQHESKLVIMQYSGKDNDKDQPIALVGKGVTFDTGGISIKPASGMEEMKCDMAGSAAVVGALQALALRKAKVNVVGVIGLVENMPGGNAQRPGDIVKTMSGQTVEVINTDAEGRLVLADAVWYVQEKFNPQFIVDLATLTGAIIVALGYSYAGCFANNDDLANELISAGSKVNEKVWKLPLDKDFDQMLKSEVADMSNLGNARGAAGSATAAHFIKRFIKNDVKWAHLDIAGMDTDKKGSATCPKGASGYGVRLLNQFIKDYYENK